MGCNPPPGVERTEWFFRKACGSGTRMGGYNKNLLAPGIIFYMRYSMKLWILIPFLAITASVSGAADLYDISLKTIEGEPTTLAPYRGKVLLVVNVASKCGHTQQYAGLEALYKEKKDEGLVILGFPCNDFGNQEPGSNEEIMAFCSRNHGVTFPLFDKIHVKGENQHPLYTLLTGPGSPFPGDVRWNFGKFLIGRDGKIISRFEPKTQPDSEELRAAVLKALD